jgi:hypothetical protein
MNKRTKINAHLPLSAVGIITALALLLANCGGGGGSSAANNPIPNLTSIAPASAPAGSRPLTITLTGSSFISSSVVRWNGSSRTTTYGSKTQLTATITAADLATAGSASVTVLNPTPGGGTSSSTAFTVVSVSPLTIPTTQLPNAYRNKAYSYAVQASGGIAPYSYSLAGGGLPAGWSFPSTGILSGTPPTVSSDTPYSFTVQATDFSNTVKTVQQGLSLVVKASGSSLGRNDTCSITTATPVTNGTIRASISPYGDVDVYSFQGTAGRAVTVEIVAQRLNLDGDATTTDVFFDSFLEILDASCNRRTYNDDLSSSTTDSMVSYTLPSTGTYFIRVSDLGGSGRPDFLYNLILSGAN